MNPLFVLACLLAVADPPSDSEAPRLSVTRRPDQLELTVFEGTRALPFDPTLARSAFAQGAGTRINVGPFEEGAGQLVWELPFPSGSAAMVGWEAVESAAEDGAIVRRSAAYLVRNERGTAAEALGKCGLDGEIRLLLDPSVLASGSTLPVRTYVEGVDTSLTVTAVRRRTRAEPSSIESEDTRILETVEFTSDAGGHGRLPLGEPGEWTLSFVHEQDREHDDESWTVRTIASLSFVHDPEGVR